MIVISGKTLMTVVIVKKHQYLVKRSTILSSIHLLNEGKRYPKSVNVYMYLDKRSTIVEYTFTD